jgi:membrane-bound lytic murein transglycosylase F
MQRIFNWKIVILFIVGLSLWMTIVKTWTAPDWRKGELFVALSPNGSDEDAKFELELVTLFAQRLHLKVKQVPMDYDQITQAVASGKVHLAAAGLRGNASSILRFGTSYQTLSEQVVCNKNPPKRLDDLAKRSLVVVAESAQEHALRSIATHQPSLHWEALHQLSTSGLMRELSEGKIDCAVANEEQIATARNFHPELGNAFDLNTQSHLAWAFAGDLDAELFHSADDFITAIKKDGTLDVLIDRHYGHNERLEAMDAVAFVSKARSVLPRFKRWFQEASALTGIEWQLLAALAYQESHWDPLATSYTNVRGLMMLTAETADRMNLEDRLDAHASIIAGAKYLQLLKEALPDRMDEKERTWMALAAYNQGMGHLEDARVLAVKSNLNPDVWSDVRKVMPLLSRPAYFEQAKHGHARGGEAVILVERVRLYYDMLNRLESENSQQLPTTSYFGLQPNRPYTFSLH